MRPRRVDVDRMRRHQRRGRLARYVEADQRQAREINERLWRLTVAPKCDRCGVASGRNRSCPACIAVKSAADRIAVFGEPVKESTWSAAFPDFYESNLRAIKDEINRPIRPACPECPGDLYALNGGGLACIRCGYWRPPRGEFLPPAEDES